MNEATLTPETTAALEDIRERKALLASLLGILRFMEGLQGGLEAMQAISDPAQKFPKSLLQFVGGLDARLTSQESPKLKDYLASIERLLKQDMTQVLQIAGADRRVSPRPEDRPPEEMTPEEARLVDDFRRRALTVIALRILLKKRGEPVSAALLPVPVDMIEETLQKLEQSRCEHTERALGESIVLKRDVEVQLQNQRIPDPVRQHLEEMRDGLRQNISHLRAGKPVSELPMPMESSQAEDVPWLTSGGAGEMEKAPEVQAPAAEAAAEAEPTKPDQPASAPEQAAADAQLPGKEKKRGVLARAWTYVTTGPEVGWDKTETVKKDE